MTTKPQDYKSMMQKLQSLITDMQAEDLDVDKVIEKYEKGQKLLIQLKKYLDSAENKITKQKLPIKSELD